MSKSEFLTTAPAAQLLKRSEQTIQNWAKKGKLPFVVASRIRLFRLADLEKLKRELDEPECK